MSDRHINVKKGMFQRSGGIYMSKSKEKFLGHDAKLVFLDNL